MTAPGETAHDHVADTHTTFFRQGTWLILATGVCGLFMVATQMVAQRFMATGEWSTFFTLLRVYLLFGIPSLGLQTMFAQQTAAALSGDQRGLLMSTVQAVLKATLALWLVLGLVAILGQSTWLQWLKIQGVAAWWATIGLGLTSLWVPVLKGIVQGRQQFPSLGWSFVLDGLGRFVAVTIIVVLLGGQAAGGMAGALLGQVAALAVVGWVARDVLRASGRGFAWKPWLGRVIPLTIGTGIIQLLSTVDVIYVRAVFGPEASEAYNRGALVGLALMTVATPLVQVMFPKVARSAALTRPSRAMSLALGSTAAVGSLAALICTASPELPLRIIFIGNPAAWRAAPLVPWFAWALLPLILAMVLINHLLARERYAVVPWMVVVMTVYLGLLALGRTQLPTLEGFVGLYAVLGTLGACNLTLLIVAVLFTNRERVQVGAEVP
jgi:O-antigen/teichoic acid export membrane protein